MADKYCVYVAPAEGQSEWPRPARWNVSRKVAELYADACRSKGQVARVAKMSDYDKIKPRCTVTFLIHGGIGRNGVEWKEKTGKVVMSGPAGWVVDGGGRYGTPYVVDEKNFVRLGR